MAIIIDTHGNLTPVYPENGRAFSFSELVELMGPRLTIYEQECETPINRDDRAHYIVTVMNARENRLDRNESASNIYAQSMKGLVGHSVYGRVLVCKLAEIDPEELRGAA